MNFTKKEELRRVRIHWDILILGWENLNAYEQCFFSTYFFNRIFSSFVTVIKKTWFSFVQWIHYNFIYWVRGKLCPKHDLLKLIYIYIKWSREALESGLWNISSKNRNLITLDYLIVLFASRSHLLHLCQPSKRQCVNLTRLSVSIFHHRCW